MNPLSKKAFSNKAEMYAKGRPSYAQNALEYLKQIGVKEGVKIADIGSGTGIFTKQLLELNAHVFGVEINDEMRHQAEIFLQDYPFFTSIKASAEETTLPPHSLDFISVAQAFHWFDPVLFKKEALRILKPTGKFILIWNIENFDSLFMTEFGVIQNKYAVKIDFHQDGEEMSYEDFFLKPAQAFLSSFEAQRFSHNLLLDEETFLNKATSSSGVVGKEDPRYESFLSELKQLFKKFAKEGVLSYPNETVLYVGTI